MANGGIKTQRIDIIDSYDPRVTGRAAAKGTTFRYIPAVGDVVILVKQDDGFSTNWVAVGAAPVADTASNLGAGEGVFASKVGTDFQFKSLVAGDNVSLSSTADEITIDAATDTASNLGAGEIVFASKVANDFQFKTLVGGSNVILSSTANEITISASGAVAPTGDANTVAFFNGGGNLDSNPEFSYNDTSLSLGMFKSTNGGSGSTSGSYALGFGLADTNGQISVIGACSLGFGFAETNGIVRTADTASMAFGSSLSGSLLETSSQGALVNGRAVTGSFILASNIGAHAGGSSVDGSFITASGTASRAYGSTNINSTISATAEGATAFGSASSSGEISASGVASLAVGSSSNGNHNAVGDSSVVFGFNQGFQTSYASVTIGQYAIDSVGSPGTWVSIEPLFVAGNGTSNASRANAYQLDKDGKIATTGAQKHACKSISADDALSARIDRSIFVDTQAAIANVTITLPAGEDGLEYFIKDSGANASVNNIIFAATGPDVVESLANITNDQGSRHLQYFSGTWWIMNLI